MVVDLDELVRALGGELHQHPDALMRFAWDARDAVHERLLHGRHELVEAWVIASAPTFDERRPWYEAGVRVVLVHADEVTCVERANAERPAGYADYVRRWFDEHLASPADEVVRSVTSHGE